MDYVHPAHCWATVLCLAFNLGICLHRSEIYGLRELFYQLKV